jgi:DNA repair protein RecO (recombination protein O)
MSGTPKSLYRDEGVVLRTQKLGEADRIVTVLTRRHGKVRAVAKGVRRTKSKFGSRLEPFSHVDLQLYTGRNLDIVSQAESIRSYGNDVVDDYPCYTAGTAVLETADRLTAEEREPSLRLFLLVIGSTPSCCGRCRWPAGNRPCPAAPAVARRARTGTSPCRPAAWSARPAGPRDRRCRAR